MGESVNLKTAARRLGVHYQTAYRWVRSGRLVAVKVGSGYEISDAAVERLQALRSAVERGPLRPLPSAQGLASPLDRESTLMLFDRMVEQVMIDARSIVERATRYAAEVLGDVAVMYQRAADADPAPLHVVHRDPVSEVDVSTLVRSVSSPFAKSVLRSGNVLFMPQVPQQEVREHLRSEFHQYLLEAGCYSAICVPIFVEGLPEAALLVSRDAPGRPYSPSDVEFVTELAARVSLAHARVSAVTHACDIRRRAVRALRHEPLARSDVFDDALPVVLEDAELDDTAAPLALVDLDLRHISCTKAYAALFGLEASDMNGVPVAALARDANWLNEVLTFVSADQLEYGTFDAEPPESGGRVMLHAAMVRHPDATKRCIIVAAHNMPELELHARN
ncbi:MAG TPA: GAF domain-containing protein [Acidimicrobiia bacterium]|nr:GAF domain-containing protein [Acidimicrobiia bacterium]